MAAMKPRPDQQHTSRDTVVNEAALDFLRNKSQAGITGYHAKVLKVQNDPSKFDLNHHGEMTDALSGQPPIRYKLSIEDESGAIFPEPETYGETPEDSILIESLPDFSPSNADLCSLNVGDTVNISFVNTNTRQGGKVDSKVSKFPDGSGSVKSSKRKLNKPSSNFEDKRPIENTIQNEADRKPEVLPRDKIFVSLSIDDYKALFPAAAEDKITLYRSYFEDARNTYAIDEIGGLSMYFSFISALSKNLSIIEDPKYTNVDLPDNATNQEIYYGRTFFYTIVKGLPIYQWLSNTLFYDFVAQPHVLLTPAMCVNASFEIMSKLSIYNYGRTWNIDAAINAMRLTSGSAEEQQFRNSCNTMFEYLKKYAVKG
jgi:hypothetical protein